MSDQEAIMKCVRGITSYVKAGDFLLAEQVTRSLLLLLGAPSSELTIPEDVWRENDALDVPETCLTATITINGCEMHLEAWAVEDVGDRQLTADLGYSQALVDLRLAVNADSPFYTITIKGRPYVLVATPFCQ